MEKKIENIFLTYANNSFRDDPQNLSRVFAEIIPWIHPEVKKYEESYSKLAPITKQLNYLIKRTIFFGQCHSKDMFIADAAKLKNKESPFSYLEDTAFDAIYSYGDKICKPEVSMSPIEVYEKSCRLADYYQQLKEIGVVGANERLNCLQCYQAIFYTMLSAVVRGDSFNELKYGLLGGLRFAASEFIVTEIVFDTNTIKRIIYIDVSQLLFHKLAGSPSITFGAYLNSIAGFSLFEFLAKDNRDKLQICQKCNKFFIRSKNDNRIKNCSDCSGKSTLSREQRKLYQRGYRKKQKQKELSIKREARIENIMKKVGCCREEAIEYIEADEAIEAEKFA